MRDKLDRYELKLLDLLQSNCTQNSTEMAEEIGLSQAPTWRRVQRLREEGYISHEVAILDRRKLGLNAMVFAHVKLSAHGRANLSAFSDAIQNIPEVLECYVLMGSVDFMLKIVAEDINSYERIFFEKLSQIPGIQEINSMVALSEIKCTTSIPVPGIFP